VSSATDEAATSALPLIISVDDHVLEPPTLWTDRLPAAHLDHGPRVVRERAEVVFDTTTGKGRIANRGAADGVWCDWWLYEDLEIALNLQVASAGIENVDRRPVTYDDVRPGCWQQAARLADMDRNHVEASVCFPNVVPRFCGQTFLEAKDRELGLLCVRAYNDWILEEWAGGAGRGRLIPVTLVPLWDADLAAQEVRRCAALGGHAVSFSENPSELGLPSLHDADRYWDPFLQACAETESIINIHIGSSSKVPNTSSDAPQVLGACLWFTNTAGALADLLVSGTFLRFPALKVALAEGQVGWIPYLLQRLDHVWRDRDSSSSIGMQLPEAPSSYVAGHVFGCIFDDAFGLANRAAIGMDQIMFETDYPHNDGTFPRSAEVAQAMCDGAGLDDDERYRLLRGNAIAAFGLHRDGVSA